MPEYNPSEPLPRISRSSFSAQFCRLLRASGCITRFQLANLLGIPPAEVSRACKRREIPDAWLITLLKKHNINPAWVRSAHGPMVLDIVDKFVFDCRACS